MPTQLTTGALVTAANWNTIPKGLLGYAQVTANQASITTEVDLTGLSVTVTIVASRYTRISAQVLASTTVSGDRVEGYIKHSSGTTIGRFFDHRFSSASVNELGFGSAVLTGVGAGSQTYKLSLSRTVGTGTVTMVAGTALPAFILVEDLGPV